jgi:hypothetical protein
MSKINNIITGDVFMTPEIPEPQCSYGIKLGYVSLKVRLEDATFIRDLVKDVPISGRLLSPHELHMTLMYDNTNPIPQSAVSMFSQPDVEHLATVVGAGLLGDEGSEHRAVVLFLESETIQERFDELSIFMTHSFGDLLLHVSVSYGATEEDASSLVPLLTSLVGTSIVLYGESFATLKED